jgi:6-phosphogluconate dehydrogenase
MNIIFIGLGKMGLNMAKRLKGANFSVYGFDINEDNIKNAKAEGVSTLHQLSDNKNIVSPRVFWIMVPHNAVDGVLKELKSDFKKGDIVVDGGNSFYEDSMRRYKELKKQGVVFMDAGVSGGPRGAKDGACIMIGGDKPAFNKLQGLWSALSAKDSFMRVGDVGAGHFAKMVHNGIEYGMMQSIAEGFAVLAKSKFKINLGDLAHLYNKGSVVESRLVGWLYGGFMKFGKDLGKVSSKVSHTGEGEWTVKTAKKMKMKVPVIEASLKFRKDSTKKKTFEGKVLTTMRHMFGGHSFK